MAIVEPMLAMLGPQITRWDQLGTVQARTGNRSANNAPRNTYRTADGSWVAVSTSAQSIAERVMTLVGRPELIDEPWFATGAGRAEHADELDDAVGRLDRAALPRRGDRRLRPRAGRDRPDLRRERHRGRSAVPGARHHPHDRRRGPRRDADAGAAVPPVRRTRPSSRSPGGRPGPTPTPCSPSSGTTPGEIEALRADGVDRMNVPLTALYVPGRPPRSRGARRSHRARTS